MYSNIYSMYSMYSNMYSKRHRDRLIGHTLRHKRLVETILEGRVEGRKRQGRQRLEYT